MIQKKVIRIRVKHDFQKFKTIRSFGREIYSRIIALNDAFEEQINLKDEIDKSMNLLNKKPKLKKRKSTDKRNRI